MTALPREMIDDGRDRGQTTFDFTLGISVFILAVVFVFMMTPSLFTPFDDNQPAAPLTADRVADHLSDSVLVESDPGKELDKDATLSFFVEESAPNEALGVTEFSNVHVEIVDSDGNLAEIDDEELTRGSSLPGDSDQVTIAQRIVMLDGETHSLHVKVW